MKLSTLSGHTVPLLIIDAAKPNFSTVHIRCNATEAESHDPDKPVVIVQHGASPNGAEYCEAWISNVMQFDLTNEETASLTRLLTNTIDADRYRLSPRIQMCKGILGMIRRNWCADRYRR
jgi:hypothetical protein